MAYILIGLVVVLLGYFIASPFLRPTTSGASRAAASNLRAEGSDDDLVVERDRLLRAIKELEFDHSTGKMNDEEYQSLRADLAAQTSRVLDAIEARGTWTGGTFSGPVAGRDAELELEILVSRARRRSDGRWACSCGRSMRASDKFCASCGSAKVA